MWWPRLVALASCGWAFGGGPALPAKLQAIENDLRAAHDAEAAFVTEELFRGCEGERLAREPAFGEPLAVVEAPTSWNAKQRFYVFQKREMTAVSEASE